MERESITLAPEALRSMRKYADGPRLRRAALQLLAQESCPEDVKAVRELFLHIDREGSGTLCYDELKDAIRGDQTSGRWRAGATPDSGEGNVNLLGDASPLTPARTLRHAPSLAIEEVIRPMDSNGDEEIYFLDFVAATTQNRTGNFEVAAHAAFHRLDPERTGTIDTHSFKRVLGATFEGVDIEELFNEVVAPGAGKLDFEAFLFLLKGVDVLQPPPPIPLSPKRGSPACREGRNNDRRRVCFFPEELASAGC